MKHQYVGEDDPSAQYLRDVELLKANQLREAYPKEARSHAAMKRRAKTQGFVVHPEWDSFRGFLRDLGPAPFPEASIDRLDPSNRMYGADLRRWADKTEQTRNRASTIWVSLRGERRTLMQVAEQVAAPYSTIYAAHRRGETADQIADRYERRSQPSDEYRPAWIADQAFSEWKGEFRRWRRGLRYDVRAKVCPELFDAIMLSKSFNKAREASSINELVPDEYEDARAGKLGSLIRLRENGQDWIEHALRALAKHDRTLAARLWRVRLHRLYEYEAALLPLPPES